jgi:ubiquinone biosynthesis protein
MLRILIPTRHTNLQAVRRDLILAFEKFRYGGGEEIADRRKLTRELTIDTMSIARRNYILMPQSMALYYKTTLTVDAILSELAPSYDPLKDLSTFFIKAAGQDRRGPVQALRNLTLHNASDRLSQLLRDIKTIATPLQLFDGTLQTAQTRAMLYGVCSIAFCIGAFLAQWNDSPVFENTTGLNRSWLVYGMLAIAAVVLVRLQRLLRVPGQKQ